mmetsp:Transcript_136619/g.436526  ORF Transcript_136619/g.436526 Transcript_136619/m.436526 type:complete len:98 (+) Transcript_136619:99-392(+)
MGGSQQSLLGILMLALVASPASCSNSTLKVGVVMTFATDYNFLVLTIMADMDFKKHFNASIREGFGPPILPIPNLNPKMRSLLRQNLPGEGLPRIFS